LNSDPALSEFDVIEAGWRSAPMCNGFGNHIPYSDYLRSFGCAGIAVEWPSAAPNLDIWPTTAASCRVMI